MVASGGSLLAAGRFDQSRRNARLVARGSRDDHWEHRAPLDASEPLAATVGDDDLRIHAGGVRSGGRGTLIGQNISNGGSQQEIRRDERRPYRRTVLAASVC